MKPFRYGIFAKLVIGTFLSFFLLLRIEAVSGGACSPEMPQLCCSTPESRVLVDTNQLFKVAMDIPGVDPKDLDVSVDTGSRTVKLVGNRRDDQGDVIGCFTKSWPLDDTVDMESLVMQHDNGVLTVWSPKDADVKKESAVSFRRDLQHPHKKTAFIRGSTTSTTNKPNKTQAATVTKLKPIITKHVERYEDPTLSEEDPMVVEPIAYDEQELLESVSVLTDDENEYWFHRM